MKKIFLIIAICAPIASNAAGPSTSCPAGWTAVESEYVNVATSCGTTYTSMGDAVSCDESTAGATCILYAPAGVSYTDDSGTYEYTDACPAS